MKKVSLKLISLVLTVSLIFSVVAVSGVSAAGSKVSEAATITQGVDLLSQKDAVQYPTIIIPGISQSQSWLADENGEPVIAENGRELSGGLLIIDSSNLVPIILKNLLFPLLTTLLTQNCSMFLKEGVIKTVKELFSIQKTDLEGKPVNNLKTEKYNCSVKNMPQEKKNWFFRNIPMREYADLVGEDMIYMFTFPLVGDPISAADSLCDYIQMVKEQTGKAKVNLVTLSLGGTVLTAYLDSARANYNDVNRIVTIVSVMNGTDLMGDFLERKFNLSDQFIYSDYLPQVMKENSNNEMLGYIINIALRILPKKAFNTILTGACDAILDTLIVNCGTFWSMVPSERYLALAERYLSGDEHAVFRAKTDKFYTAQLNLKTNLLRLENDFGASTYSVAGYGYSYLHADYNFFGIMASSETTNSDAIIPINSTTIGASFVPAGQEFSSAYIATHDANLISPDKSIDLSTCLFPTNVWVLEDQHHEAGRTDVIIKLATRIMLGCIDDVNTAPEQFPQFNLGRVTYKLTRDYIPAANSILADRSKYPDATAEQFSTLEKAVVDAEAMLAQTNVYEAPNAYDTIQNFLAALSPFGDWKPVPEPDAKTIRNTKIAKSASDAVMKYWGGRGFSDWFYPYFYL